MKGLEDFKKQSTWLIENGKLDRSKITLRTANSFATLEVPEARLDMVRPGGALFGDTFPSHTEYKRVMEFKSRLRSDALDQFTTGLWILTHRDLRHTATVREFISLVSDELRR